MKARNVVSIIVLAFVGALALVFSVVLAQDVDKVRNKTIWAPQQKKGLVVIEKVGAGNMPSIEVKRVQFAAPNTAGPIHTSNKLLEKLDTGGEKSSLILKYGQKEYGVKSVSNGTVIQTDDADQRGPGCVWLFWGGEWWYICDE